LQIPPWLQRDLEQKVSKVVKCATFNDFYDPFLPVSAPQGARERDLEQDGKVVFSPRYSQLLNFVTLPLF